MAISYKYPDILYLKKIKNSPVTGSFIKFNTAPGFSLILKQMASSFCGTDIMKCGSPSTVKANHRYLYCDTQVQSSAPTFNVVATELQMLGTSRNWPLHKLCAQLSPAHPPAEWWGPKEAATSPQSELRPFPPHHSQVCDIHPAFLDYCKIWHVDCKVRMATSKVVFISEGHESITEGEKVT